MSCGYVVSAPTPRTGGQSLRQSRHFFFSYSCRGLPRSDSGIRSARNVDGSIKTTRRAHLSDDAWWGSMARAYALFVERRWTHDAKMQTRDEYDDVAVDVPASQRAPVPRSAISRPNTGDMAATVGGWTHGRCCGSRMRHLAWVDGAGLRGGMVQHRPGHDADGRVAHFLPHIATTSGRAVQTRLMSRAVLVERAGRRGVRAAARGPTRRR